MFMTYMYMHNMYVYWSFLAFSEKLPVCVCVYIYNL